MQEYLHVRVRDTPWRIVDSSHPDAGSSKTRSTEILVPLITGFPVRTAGSRIIRGAGFMKTNRMPEIVYLCRLAPDEDR
jgi:hypothetical protein